jgi:hypothetical protein
VANDCLFTLFCEPPSQDVPLCGCRAGPPHRHGESVTPASRVGTASTPLRHVRPPGSAPMAQIACAHVALTCCEETRQRICLPPVCWSRPCPLQLWVQGGGQVETTRGQRRGSAGACEAGCGQGGTSERTERLEAHTSR